MRSTRELEGRLRARGERLTPQRRAVIDVLAQAEQHLTMQAVQQQAAAKGVDLNEPTVYRILQWLNDLGVVSQTDLGQGGCVYELIAEQPHHHLVCLACGSVLEVDDRAMAGLREFLRQEYAFEPRIDHMAVYGICRVCREAGEQ